MRFAYTLICLLMLCARLYSQDVTIPVSSSEKFNKRGFYKNDDAFLNGNEVISDYDGNLMLNYSTRLDLANDLGSDFTITYNSNLEHRVFRGGDMNSPGYSINAPEWILGYKGFALQTLNFETNFYYGHQGSANYSTFYSGEEIPLLIPGYHYSNALKTTQGSNRFDVITILRADGSKIHLQNTRPNDANVTYNARTGLYNEIGLNTYGFAIVELYNNPDDTLPAGSVNHFRRIWYKPGDGFTYVFDEKEAKLNYKPYTIQEASPDSPKILYLTMIYSSNSNYTSSPHLEFLYDGEVSSITKKRYGRKFFSGIRRFDYSENIRPNSLDVIYGSNKKSMVNIVIKNNTKNDKIILYTSSGGSDSQINTSHYMQVNPYASLLDTVRDSYDSRIYCVKSIEDNLKRRDSLDYFSWDESVNYFV